MAHTVVALYDDFDTARRVVEELVSAGFDREDISLVANDASGSMGSTLKTDKDDVTAGEGAGFGAVVGTLIGLGVALIPGVGPVLAAGPLAAALMAGIGAAAGAATGGIAASLIDLGMSEDEAGYYNEGLRGGGTLVTVSLDDDTYVGRAQDIMNRYNPIDVNDRFGGSSLSSDTSGLTTGTSGLSSGQKQSSMGTTNRNVDAGDQVSLPVVEEELNVGKRTVEEGVARVRSVVRETPVEEQVHLRDEHVTVERHPVDRPADPNDLNAFREQTIEVTERREEPVVQKQARVVEEVVVGKEVEEHTETVRDTVRRTDVEIENAGTTGRTGSMSGMTYRPYTDYETDFHTHYDTNYASSGYTFDQYTPAYRYGYTLATTDRYGDYDWDRLEPEARRYWEERNPNTWERFKDSIREAWDRVRGR
ncbi:MAG: DUF2382 domain-containing protein [Chloroflexi bacterium]|nr:DUF2382 domain-containing protein [Chloroflexota bacterium]